MARPRQLLEEARRASWAVVQGTGPGDGPGNQEGVVVTGTVPPWLPQSAPAAEHVAARVISCLVASQAVRVVGDCQGVVDGCRRGPRTEAAWRSTFYGGVWRRLWSGPRAALDSCQGIAKVRAHRTSEERDQLTAAARRWCDGNEKADEWAKRARAEHPEPASREEDLALVDDAVATCRLIAAASGRWPAPFPPGRASPPVPRRAGPGPPGPPPPASGPPHGPPHGAEGPLGGGRGYSQVDHVAGPNPVHRLLPAPSTGGFEQVHGRLRPI